MAVIDLTAATFEAEAVKSDKKVLIDFWASWCGPCRAFSPIIEAYASAHPDVKVCKVNVDEEPQLAQAFQVMSIPTAVVMQNGEVINRVSGAMNPAQLESFMQG